MNFPRITTALQMHNSQALLLKTGFKTELKRHQVEVLKILNEEVQAIVLLDSAPSHPNTSKLCCQDCKIWYLAFPPLTTSLTQPMDQGVLCACT
jgi:hypothetical protein